jgi:hypothetical protein
MRISAGKSKKDSLLSSSFVAPLCGDDNRPIGGEPASAVSEHDGVCVTMPPSATDNTPSSPDVSRSSSSYSCPSFRALDLVCPASISLCKVCRREDFTVILAEDSDDRPVVSIRECSDVFCWRGPHRVDYKSIPPSAKTTTVCGTCVTDKLWSSSTSVTLMHQVLCEA